MNDCCKSSVEELKLDGSRVRRVASFWENNKSWLIPTIFTFVGATGGNLDRVEEFVPVFEDSRVDGLNERVTQIENGIEKVRELLEKKLN